MSCTFIGFGLRHLSYEVCVLSNFVHGSTQCSKTSPCLGLNAEVSEGSKQQVFELRSADFAKEEQSGHNLIFVAF